VIQSNQPTDDFAGFPGFPGHEEPTRFMSSYAKNISSAAVDAARKVNN